MVFSSLSWVSIQWMTSRIVAPPTAAAWRTGARSLIAAAVQKAAFSTPWLAWLTLASQLAVRCAPDQVWQLARGVQEARSRPVVRAGS